MITAEITATVIRTANGWTGRTSLGNGAYIRDGQAWWFHADNYPNRLTDAEEHALGLAAMRAINEP